MRRRVAFDIGSGATKCLIADVDVQSSRIISVIHGEEVPVPFAFEYKRSRDGTLSEEVQAVGISVLNKFCRKATELGVTQSAAIATEVFRKAANGQAFIERVRAELGLSVQVPRPPSAPCRAQRLCRAPTGGAAAARGAARLPHGGGARTRPARRSRLLGLGRRVLPDHR